MKLKLGYDDYARARQGKDIPIIWDAAQLINPHILICGKSGMGKTHLLRKMIAGARVRFHVFDVHSDIRIAGESRVVFSEATRYGYNPLLLDTDPHTGGVRRTINRLICTLNRTSRKLGDRQEAVLRALLQDVYFLGGCYDDNPQSWRKKEIDEATRRALIDARRYPELKEFYPTLDDLVGFAERKLKAMYLGSEGNGVGNRCVTAIDETNRSTAALKRMSAKAAKMSGEDAQGLETKITAAKTRALSAFEEYLDSIETGRELDEVIKYDSREVLKSIVDRIKNLNAVGIFRATRPPFDEKANVWVYDIKHLPVDEQTLFVHFRMQDIFRRRVSQGVQTEIQEVIVSDEASRFFSDDSDNIYNVVVNEGRKFGMGLWCASQAPTHFSEDFLTTVGTKILLGIDSFFWQACCRKLNIDESVLKFITPHKTAAIHMDRKGEINAKFKGVQLEGAA